MVRILIMKKNGKYAEALLSRYRSYTGSLLKKKVIRSVNEDSMILAEEIAKTFPGTGSVSDGTDHEAFIVAGIVRKAAFSGQEISAEEYGKACESMARILKAEPVKA